MSADKLTFEALVALEPRLTNLEALARQVADEEAGRKRRCANRCFQHRVKPQMIQLVGTQRTWVHPVLSGSAAYCCAYAHLHALMPTCRGCACLSM